MAAGCHAPGLVHRRVYPARLGVLDQFGAKLTSAAPGSAKGYLIVSDIEAARDRLVAAGVEVSEIFHIGSGGRVSGPDPGAQLLLARHVQRSRRQRLAAARGHDAAPWARRPGATSFGSASDLASALRRAEAAHGQHEKRIGNADPNWPDWYAEYMAASRPGRAAAGERL